MKLPPQKYRKTLLELGIFGEEIAASYLHKNGYKIIYRNFKARYGELDIICIKDKTLVIVEVKTRLNMNYGYPEEAVTDRKLREVIKTAEYFVSLHEDLPEEMRIDVIGIVLDSDNRVKYFRHIENVTAWI